MKTKTTKPKPRVMWANRLNLPKDADIKLWGCAQPYARNALVRVAVIPLCDVEAIVERAALAGTNVARKFCDQPPLKYLRQSQNPAKNMELIRAALTAAGIPCK
jgi:hypothetical protein